MYASSMYVGCPLVTANIWIGVATMLPMPNSFVVVMIEFGASGDSKKPTVIQYSPT
ncbi:hypothetical protein D3C87_2048260 [compost metagenome]